MEILEAYCVELDQVLTIYDAQKAYFAMLPAKRKRFTFRCSDPDCRHQNDPLVSGINYDKLAEESDKYRQIHFRAPAGHPHAPDCYWVGEDAARRKPVPADGDAAVPRVERAKKTNVIDIFNPKLTDDSLARPHLVGTGEGPAQSAPHEAREPHQKYRAREGYSSTARLERFINCWSQLEGDELKQNEVVLAGRTLSYRQAVSRPEWITPADNGARIVQGGVKAMLWPKDAPKRLYLNFMSECDKFPEHEGGRTLTIDLPLARIEAYNGGTLLLERIKQGQSKGHYVRIYCWGDIMARDKRQGYQLELASLDNLVIKAVPIKQKKTEE